jgi:hemin uptake protein HemP
MRIVLVTKIHLGSAGAMKLKTPQAGLPNKAVVTRQMARLSEEGDSRQGLDSGVLFAGGSEVVIMHGDEIYRLRLTRQNRLILTK